ncbi:MAG: hypothetical protein AAF202_14280, partial [Pseudomonadota bacterium]
MRSCWHDETQYEARHCSTLQMTFDAEFVRPARTPEEMQSRGLSRDQVNKENGINLSSDYMWNPALADVGEPHRRYYATLPNKYDLLPGEVEDVQVFTNSSMSTSIRPAVAVGDQWNDYEYGIQWTRRQCHHAEGFHADIKIFTEGRRIKKTPNAFAIPETKESQWLRRTLEPNKDGGDDIPYRPVNLELVDTSDAIISAMARQSRGMESKINQVKTELGMDSNVSGDELNGFIEENQEEEGFGFTQDTRVRIRLIEEKPLLLWNRMVSQKLYIRGSDVEYKGGWDLDLDGSSADRSLYAVS